MKGGARARSGPPPDPNALKRERDGAEWINLPASGRQGDPPEWPLGGKPTKREAELWSRLWCKPQAIMWELRGQELEVALFVRRFREAEKPGSPVNLSTWVRQTNEALGLSGPGLRFNKWRIVPDDMAVKREERRAVSSGRDRLTIVDSDAG